MAFNKITNTDIATYGVQAESDEIKGSAAEKKAMFDRLATRIATLTNAVIDLLNSTAAGNSGANNIGSAAISGVSGNNVWAQIADLKAQLSDFALGEIGDGTLTKAKFADFDSDVQVAELTDYELPESAGSVSSTDTLIEAIGKLQKTLDDLGTVLTDYRADLASGDVVVAKATEAESATTISLDLIYPVGSIYISVNSTNPTAYWGGTWTAWGAGRVPVGVDSSQTEFNTVEEIGGEKTHTLTESEMPAHTHNVYIGGGTGTQGLWANDIDSRRQSISSGSAGSGQPHNNLQPYITCYMWKRTA